MDAIFVKTKNIFTVVSTAKHEPRRYDKNGNMLIQYEDTDMAERRGSVLSTRSAKDRVASMSAAKKEAGGAGGREVEDVEKDSGSS